MIDHSVVKCYLKRMTMNTNPAPKRKRQRDDDRNDLPVSFLPTHNRWARWAYICALLGLIPVLGLILGLPALIFGYFGYRYQKRKPEARGGGHAIVSMGLGGLEVLLNLLGLSLIAYGLGWFSPD